MTFFNRVKFKICGPWKLEKVHAGNLFSLQTMAHKPLFLLSMNYGQQGGYIKFIHL